MRASATVVGVNALVERLGLKPHPEGGFFRETYRAAASLPDGRSVCTAIQYLLAKGDRSSLHRIDADEIWHFYRGDGLLVVELQQDAAPRITRVDAENPQHLVKAGTWFGARVVPEGEYALVGCTVSPAFEFAHFELGKRRELELQYPLARSEIHLLTRADS